MKSVKGVIIGFLLLLIGICLIQVQLIVATGVATSGLVTVVICALPKRLWEQEALRNAEREKQKQQAAAARIGEELDASVQQTAEQMHTAEETVPQASLEAAEAELLTADASELGQELSLDELLQQAQALIGGSPARLEQAAVRREPERAAGAAPAEPNIERSAKPEHVPRRQPKQPRGTRPGRAQLAAQLEQLGRAYTAIDAMTGGRGPAQAQQDIAACDAFRTDWEAACSDEAFASLVQSRRAIRTLKAISASRASAFMGLSGPDVPLLAALQISAPEFSGAQSSSAPRCRHMCRRRRGSLIFCRRCRAMRCRRMPMHRRQRAEALRRRSCGF